MKVEIIMSIPIISSDERSLGPIQSIHCSWCIINSLVGSQPDQMKHINIIKGWWGRRSVNPRVDGEFFSSIVSVYTYSFMSNTCASILVYLITGFLFVVIALYGHIAVGRWSDGSINFCKHLLQSGFIHDVFSWRGAARVYPIGYGGNNNPRSSAGFGHNRDINISYEHQYDRESNVSNFPTG